MATTVRVIRNDFGSIAAQVVPKSSRAVSKTTFDIHGLAVETSPYDTGNLANTHATEFEDNGQTGAVTVGADYGPHVHEGHATVNGGYVAGRPWLADAANHYQPEFEAALGDVFEP